jgi:Zn-dependent protease with chaperone function
VGGARTWSAGTTRRAALLATVCVFASLLLVQDLSVRAGVRPEVSWLPAVLGTSLVLVLAVAGHLRAGARRRHAPVPPELVPELARLTARAGVTRAPEFVVNPRALTTGAVTRGRAGRYRLVLDAGLVCRYERAPARLRAVVLHELAHVRNRDVEVAQLTVALWRVTSLGVLLPYVSVTLGAGAWGSIGVAAAICTVLYLLYTEVLRSRELYADRDAVFWGADPREWAEPDEPDLPDTVPALLVLLGRLLVTGTTTWFATLLRTHPTPARRRRALADPDSTAAATMVGNSIYGMVLTGATIALLFVLVDEKLSTPGTPTEWPLALQAVLLYPAVVVCIAALLVAPSRRNGAATAVFVPISPQYRRRTSLAVLLIFGTVLGTLYACDPIHVLSGDLPRHIQWPVQRFPEPPTTWATPRSPALVELGRSWQRRGALAAQARLDLDLSHLRQKIKQTQPRHINWNSFATDCAAINRDVDSLDALGDFPYPDARQPWSVLKDRSRAAVGRLCQHRYTAREFQPLEAAAEDITRAMEASRTVTLVLLHYTTDQ